jgi:hypothetical protein
MGLHLVQIIKDSIMETDELRTKCMTEWYEENHIAFAFWARRESRARHNSEWESFENECKFIRRNKRQAKSSSRYSN